MAVQAGENGAGRHHFAGLVPAVSVAESGSVALTFLIQDGIQPGQQHTEKKLRHTGTAHPVKGILLHRSSLDLIWEVFVEAVEELWFSFRSFRGGGGLAGLTSSLWR